MINRNYNYFYIFLVIMLIIFFIIINSYTKKSIYKEGYKGWRWGTGFRGVGWRGNNFN